MSGADQEARRLIREDLDTSLFVEAAAGTGKTSELIRRVIASIAHGKARVDETVIVTFTRKAAGEIKLRLRQALEEARSDAQTPEEKLRLELAITHLEDARVGTIHAFASDLLRERPVEARLDPEFVALEEHEAMDMFRRIFGAWFERRLEQSTPGLQRILSRTPPRYLARRSPKDRLVDAAWLVSNFRDFDAPWPREDFDRNGQLDELLARSAALIQTLDRAARPRDPLTRSIAPLRRVVEWAERARLEGALDWDELEGLFVEAGEDLRFARDKRGHGAFLGEGEASRADLCVQRDSVLDQLDRFITAANADLASELRNELFEVSLAYERKKAELGKLDFTDLLLRTRDLLRGHAPVRASFQRRWGRIYVDELQDTDPLQMEILLLLAADDPEAADWQAARPRPGKLFLVGDPKQSIYGFRRADLGLYQRVKAGLTDRGVKALTLSVSFRATEPIQRFVNHCFSPVMLEDHTHGQPSYVPLEGGPAGHSSVPDIVALPVADPEGTTRQSRARVAKALPDLVATFTRWLLEESGWTVRVGAEPELRQPIRPHHVAILFRRYTEGQRDVTAPYLRALEARSLPHVVVGARAFHDEEEIETLRAAAIAIEWPEDELAVFATLRGALFAIEDESLLRYRLEVGELQPLARTETALPLELESIGVALALLRRLHVQRNERPILETITELLELTRAHAGFALRPAGPKVLANLHRLTDLASAFERRGGLSFRGFVEQLEEGAEHATAIDAPVVEASAEGIRVITAHSAKGLEFPVVILADLDGAPSRRNPARHLDGETRLAALRLMGLAPKRLTEKAETEVAREAAEDLRLAYVATTRARDLLVVPAVETGPFPSWFSVLNRGLYPPTAGFERRGVGTEPVVPAGGHEIEGAGRVVWWDLAGRELHVPERRGLRAQDLLRVPSADEAESARVAQANHDSWRARRASATDRGARPSLRPFTATAAETHPAGTVPGLQIEHVARELDRPAGPRFGTLVHRLMQEVDLRRPEELLEARAALEGRVLGATEAEVKAAVVAVERALQHPLLRAAAEASYLERELPVRLHNADGTLLEGEIDLVFGQPGEALFLVDFKTDRDPSARLEKYERQLAWYAAALEVAHQRPVSAFILVV